MIEQVLKDGLDEAVTKEPPMRFDADDLVATARKSARHRRAMAATFAATAVLAGGAVTATTLMDGDGPAPVAPAAPTSTSTAHGKTQTPSFTEASRRLGDSLATAIGKHVDGATGIDVHVGAPENHLVNGWISFAVNGKAEGISYRAEYRSCTTCGDTPEVGHGNHGYLSYFTPDTSSKHVGLALTTGSSVADVVDSDAGPTFSKAHPCRCRLHKHLRPLSKKSLVAIATDRRLAIPDADVVKNDAMQQAEKKAMQQAQKRAQAQQRRGGK